MAMSDHDALSEFAPAKVNLYLHVTGRRQDGYHLLDSLMVSVSVGDRLTFRPSKHLSLGMDGPQAHSLQADQGDNIILRAARLLAELTGHAGGAAIHLHKVLPVSSGIGGGSSDAAATLRGLCRLWQVQPTPQELAALALRLGADVPFCMSGHPCQASGIGEILHPAVPLPPIGMVLVNPMFPVSTPAVFKARQGDFSPPFPVTDVPADAAGLAAALRLRQNDLALPACQIEPDIQECVTALADQPGCLLSRMSGSGATCFGLFAEEMAAQQAAQRIRHAHPHWWCEAASLLD